MDEYVVAVDIGGTFTDIVMLGNDGTRRSRKISSSPPDFEQAIIQGLSDLLGETQTPREAVKRLPHGTTVATNAILEHRGVRTALVTTKGFRDVLEIARLRRPSLFDITFVKPPPLAPRELRFEVDERVTADGSIQRKPSELEVEAIAEELLQSDVRSVAICFLNSYRNPANESYVAAELARLLHGVHITTSHQILPEIKEYERTSTAVVNAYIRPTVARYLEKLDEGLSAIGITCDVQVMQSNGSLLDSHTSGTQPVRLIESGPAAGVIATQALASTLGIANAVAFDMGGTTAKASLIEEGRAFEAPEHEVGGLMNQSRLFVQGGGYTVRVPSIDIAEVGAGGGSIFWIDQGGAPHVGPRSAGAVPGPVCYLAGGADVTVTDANLVLGYLNPVSLAGGSQPVDLSAAEEAVKTQVAQGLGLSLLEGAYGVHTLANTSMGQAIRGVSIERGRDPRNFALIAYGGAGPMHAALIAQQFEIEQVIVPVNPGLFSAIGLHTSDIRYDYVASYPHPDEPDHEVVSELFVQLESKARSSLSNSLNGAASLVGIERFLDQRYRGQSFELSVRTISNGPIGETDLVQAARDFHAAHEKSYGHSAMDEPIQLINLRLKATLATEKVSNIFQVDGEVGGVPTARSAYFGRSVGTIETQVVPRLLVPMDETEGPLIVEDMDATTVVPPYHHVRRDEMGNLLIRPGARQ